MVPSEAFDKALLQNNSSAFVTVIRFKNMGSKVLYSILLLFFLLLKGS